MAAVGVRMKFWWLALAMFCSSSHNLILSGFTNITDSNHEGYLASQLVRGYKERGTGSRPVLNATQPVQVRLNVWLIQILEFDIKQQVISTLVWKEYEWADIFLTWDPADFGGLDRVFLKPHQIWTPDIELYNTIDDITIENHEHRMLVWYNGTVVWVPHLIYRSTCPVDVTNFPFDTQECTMKFGSWVYGASFLELSLFDTEGFKLDKYSPNVEWDLLHTDIIQEGDYFYGDFYHTLTFKMTLKRNSGLWVLLILLPMILLSAITCLVFWIPPHRPDRTTISMSLFSSFFLLLLLIVESSPPTSATRLVLCCTMNIVMVALALVLSVISVNLYGGRGDCRKHLKDMYQYINDKICNINTQRLHLIRATLPQSQVKGTLSESLRKSPDAKMEKKPELSRRQKQALTLDTIAFILFLTSFIFMICVMYVVP